MGKVNGLWMDEQERLEEQELELERQKNLEVSEKRFHKELSKLKKLYPELREAYNKGK